MAKAFFLNFPAYGHMNPTLPLVQELVDRGEAIVYYTGEEFRERVEKAGAEFRSHESLGEAVRFQFGDESAAVAQSDLDGSYYDPIYGTSTPTVA